MKQSSHLQCSFTDTFFLSQVQEKEHFHLGISFSELLMLCISQLWSEGDISIAK